MKFRYARHTDNLKPLIKFYTEIIGLKILGEFKNHSNYSGVFLGHENVDWHIEFTESNEKAKHHADPDDLLVFYVKSESELSHIKAKAIKSEIAMVKPKNPYWQNLGIQINDPDNFGVIISLLKK